MRVSAAVCVQISCPTKRFLNGGAQRQECPAPRLAPTLRFASWSWKLIATEEKLLCTTLCSLRRVCR